jgi:hypothetical protein
MWPHGLGQTVPRRPFEYSACAFLCQAHHLYWAFVPQDQCLMFCLDLRIRGNPVAPLLKVERHRRLSTLLQQISCPIGVHCSRGRAT